MKLFYLLASLFLILVWLYSVIFNGYEPTPTDILILAVLHLVASVDGDKKNKD